MLYNINTEHPRVVHMNKVKPSDTNVEAEAGADVTKLSVDVVSGSQYMSCTCGQPILH